jgi:formylmethanofuran dehydrogenase subunit E
MTTIGKCEVCGKENTEIKGKMKYGQYMCISCYRKITGKSLPKRSLSIRHPSLLVHQGFGEAYGYYFKDKFLSRYKKDAINELRKVFKTFSEEEKAQHPEEWAVIQENYLRGQEKIRKTREAKLHSHKDTIQSERGFKKMITLKVKLGENEFYTMSIEEEVNVMDLPTIAGKLQTIFRIAGKDMVEGSIKKAFAKPQKKFYKGHAPSSVGNEYWKTLRTSRELLVKVITARYAGQEEFDRVLKELNLSEFKERIKLQMFSWKKQHKITPQECGVKMFPPKNTTNLDVFYAENKL